MNILIKISLLKLIKILEERGEEHEQIYYYWNFKEWQKVQTNNNLDTMAL